VAEDTGAVIRTGATASVPLGDYDRVVVTKDWTPLEPEVIEEKYAPGVGKIRGTHVAGGEGRVELVEYTPGG